MQKYINREFIEKGKIEDREYQRNLCESVQKNGSSLIVAPTALGKTIVAALAIARELEKNPEKKILFLAPTKPLAEQHKKTLKDVMDINKGKFITLTGKIKPEERYREWEDKQVITATPQTVRNDLLNGKIPLEEFTLVIFDEAHRAVKDYAYVLISDEYHKNNQDPLVLGLTASPGSSKDKIERVCRNLGIDNIEIKTEDDPDVQPYVHKKEFNWIKVQFPEELEKVKKTLQEYMSKLYSELKETGHIESYNVNKTKKKDLLQLRKELVNTEDKDRETYQAISHVAGLMKIHHALELLETQGVSPTLNYMEKLKRKKDKTKAGKRIVKDPKIQRAIVLLREMKEKDKEHPKLPRTVRKVKEKVQMGKKVLLFSQYRDTVQELVKRLQEEDIKARKFIGQTKKGKEKGMTQKQQKQILEKFEEDDEQVLVATQIAEEGLDIPSVDTVIFYEPIPSEIRHIQRKGRAGRRKKGEVLVFMTEDTRDEAYYWISKNKEKKMKKMLKKWREEGKEPLSKHDPDRKEAQKTLGKYSEEKERPKIYVDNREIGSGVVKSLRDKNVDITTKQLKVGDFLASEETVIERKTHKDFISSIIDNRLFEQARELKENFKKPIIIIEGEKERERNIHPNAVRGAISSIAIDFQIPILHTDHAEDTAALINQIAKREQIKEKKEVRLKGEKKPVLLPEQQLYVTQSLPGIGPQLAKELLQEFGTIEELFTASEQELKRTEGIGEKKAKEIKKLLTKEWEEEE